MPETSKKKASATAASKAVKRFSLPRLRRQHKDDEKVGYFEGSWRELKQVRWPDRHATWSLTLAVILFSLFLSGIILGLDYLYNEVFRKVLL